MNETTTIPQAATAAIIAVATAIESPAFTFPLLPPAGVVLPPAGLLSPPAGLLSPPAGVLSPPAGVLSPGVVSPPGVVLSPPGVNYGRFNECCFLYM